MKEMLACLCALIRSMWPLDTWVHEVMNKEPWQIADVLVPLLCRLAGTMPANFAQLPILSEVKYNNNYGIFGTIPAEYGSMPRLRRLLVEYNQMTGTIPQTFRYTVKCITISGQMLVNSNVTCADHTIQSS